MNSKLFETELKKLYPTMSLEIRSKVVNVFCQSQNNYEKFCLMGNIKDLKTITGFKKSSGFVQVEGSNICNFRFTDDTQSGNIQNVDEWILAINDAWLYGGIVGGSIFNFVSDGVIVLAEFFDTYGLSKNDQYPITVTMREVVGLFINGYIPYYNDKTGALLFQKGKEASIKNLEEYYERLKDFGLAEGMKPTQEQIRNLKTFIDDAMRNALHF